MIAPARPPGGINRVPLGGTGEAEGAPVDLAVCRLLRDAQATPWRNGGGTTRELLAWPSGPNWCVRVSVADIDVDGPFSAFPGVRRWFTVLSGAGVELGLPGGPVQLRPGDPACSFDGGDAPLCRLLGGPTRDLNLMLRGAIGRIERADVGVAWRPAAGQCGLFARVAGRVATDHDPVQTVRGMALLWWARAPGWLIFHADDAASGTDAAATSDGSDPAMRGAGRTAVAAAVGWWLAATPDADANTEAGGVAT